MNRCQALQALELFSDADAESIADALDDMVFPIRDYVLRNTPVPALFLSRMRQLKRWMKVQQTLGIRNETIGFETIDYKEHPAELVEFLRWYSLRKSKLLLNIAKGLQPALVLEGMQGLLQLQEAYNQKVAALLMPDSKNKDNIKVGKQADAGVFIRTWIAWHKKGAPFHGSAFLMLQTEVQRTRNLLALPGYKAAWMKAEDEFS